MLRTDCCGGPKSNALFPLDSAHSSTPFLIAYSTCIGRIKARVVHMAMSPRRPMLTDDLGFSGSFPNMFRSFPMHVAEETVGEITQTEGWMRGSGSENKPTRN